MTYAPQALLDLRHYLQPLTGLPDSSLGIVGDAAHIGGYHHGWDQRAGSGDYSWSESTRDSSHRTNAAAAMDVGMFARLRELSNWLVQQCSSGAADTLDIREVIYSPDGRTVKRWDRLGIRSTGDSSHLTHTHISFFRDAEGRDKTAVFERFFEGGNMSLAERNQGFMVQDGLLGLDPEIKMSGEGYEEQVLPNPLEAVLRALFSAQDANIPEFLTQPARVWKNELAALIRSIAVPPPAEVEVDYDLLAEAMRPIVAQECEAAVRKVLGAVDGATPQG